jgi:hypothetical protein
MFSSVKKAMRAIPKIQTFIESFPESVDAQALARLILSLQAEAELSSSDLYKLNAEHFDWAMELLRDWRIDRFYRGRAKAFNLDSTPP